MQTPPLLSSKSQGDWWSRNWKWVVPLICFLAILLIWGFVAVVLGFMKSSDAYTGAVARVRSTSAVIDALGTPIQEGFFVTETINVSGATGKAELAIPIEGPKGKGTIFVEATKKLGEWRFDLLIVVIEPTHLRIDLLKSEKPNSERSASQQPTPDAG